MSPVVVAVGGGDGSGSGGDGCRDQNKSTGNRRSTNFIKQTKLNNNQGGFHCNESTAAFGCHSQEMGRARPIKEFANEVGDDSVEVVRQCVVNSSQELEANERRRFAHDDDDEGQQHSHKVTTNKREGIPRKRRKRIYRRSLSQCTCGEAHESKSSESRCPQYSMSQVESPSHLVRHSSGQCKLERLQQHRSSSPNKRVLARSNTNYDVTESLTSKISIATLDKKSFEIKSQQIDLRDSSHSKDTSSVIDKRKKKKKIATYFDDNNSSSKDLAWLTDVVETQNESESNSELENNLAKILPDDCVFGDENCILNWKSQSTAGTGIKKSQALNQGKSRLVNCATSVILANFPSEPRSDNPKVELRDELSYLKSDENRKGSPHRAVNLVNLFKYPRLQTASSSCSSTTSGIASNISRNKQSTSTCSDTSFDLNSSLSKTKLTRGRRRRRSSSPEESSLRLSIDNLRHIMEKNLIATLIGVYILVSLAIIVVLILPYIFNFNRQSTTVESSSSSSAPLVDGLSGTRQINQVAYQRLSSSDKQAYEIGVAGMNQAEDQGITQTVASLTQVPGDKNLPPIQGPLLVSPLIEITPNEASESLLLPSDFDEEVDQKATNSNSTTTATPQPSQPSPSPLPYKKDTRRFSDKWAVRHNQQCHPMKVPFCSKSMESILNDKGAPMNRLHVLSKNNVAYDRTLLPNQFTRARQSQIERTLQKYEPIIDVKCYALMPLFLCSIYAPKCVQVTTTANKSAAEVQLPHEPVVVDSHPLSSSSSSLVVGDGIQSTNDGRRAKAEVHPSPARQSSSNSSVALLIPPCRSLCKEAFRKCMFFFEVLSLKLLDQEDCDSLPESPDPLVCVGQLENELLQRAAGSQSCGEDKFRCTDGECISKKWRCDGFHDCTDKSDEFNCSKCNALTQFYCGQEVCINKEQVCNGIQDCRDGRDERQCLRLLPRDLTSTTKAGTNGPTRLQQLQAWSAVKDMWVPVCGAHWSAMPMSHQACQALGYSRANETFIIYRPSAVGSAISNVGGDSPRMIMMAQKQQQQQNISHSKVQPQRTRIHPHFSRNHTSTGDERPRNRRAPSGWFDLSSGDSYTTTQSGDVVAKEELDADRNEQLASMVEDMESSADSMSNKGGSNHDMSHKIADHLIHYELLTVANQAIKGQAGIKGAAGGGGGGGVKGGGGGANLERLNNNLGRNMEQDLASIDATEIKLKSLYSMLYYGPEAGCIGHRPNNLVSSVHLQCQNFQCGRSISSYSSRVRLQQRLAKQSITPDTKDSRRSHGNLGARSTSAALRSPVGKQNLTPGYDNNDDAAAADGDDDDDDDDLESDNAAAAAADNEPNEVAKYRLQHLEATEELGHDGEDHPIGDADYEHDDDAALSDKLTKQTSLDESLLDSSSSSTSSSIISSRFVVGGTESMPGEFPYLAALHGGPDEVFFCGGVLISINWLLTAAHCVGNRTQPDGWMVKVGVTRRIASPAFVKKLKVRKIIKHPNFNQGSMFNNDIALILLEESVEFNQYLRPICLPRANLKLGPDNSKDCVVVGFGKSKYSQEANYLHVAHFVNVPIVHHTTCSNWYAEHGVNLTEGMLCAGYAEGKRDACQGDSGSGLFCRYSNTNQFFVAGVVSFGIKCANPKLPGIYTSVPVYVSWVEQTTRQHGHPLT